MTNCDGECVIKETTGISVEFDHRADTIAAKDLAAIRQRWLDAETGYTSHGCRGAGCYCKPNAGKGRSRVTHEFHAEKVVTTAGTDSFITGWVTVEVITRDGRCSRWTD